MTLEELRDHDTVGIRDRSKIDKVFNSSGYQWKLEVLVEYLKETQQYDDFLDYLEENYGNEE